MLDHIGPPDGIYVLGSGHRAHGELLGGLRLAVRPVMIGHELTPYTRAALLAGRFDALVCQNVGHLARSALRVLRALADGTALDRGQERLRPEIVIRENLPPEVGQPEGALPDQGTSQGPRPFPMPSMCSEARTSEGRGQG